MQKKKLPRDANSLAARIVAMSTGQEPPDLSAITGAQIGNPPIVKDEKKKLSAARRKKIAAKAAAARWTKKRD
jgi:hypothetical protein